MWTANFFSTLFHAWNIQLDKLLRFLEREQVKFWQLGLHVSARETYSGFENVASIFL